MQVVVHGRIVTYSKTGVGPLILALHGWADSAATFDQLTAEFKKDYTVLAPDLAGFGGSEAPAEAWGLNDYATSVAEFLKKVNVSQRDVQLILGHSNGGAIAIQGLASGTLQAKKLILLASAGVRSEQSGRKKMLAVAAKGGKLATLLLPKTKRQALREHFYKKIGSDLLIAPHMEATFKKVVQQDIQDIAGLITIPTLLIYGALDTQTPPHYGQLLKDRIKNSRLEVLPDLSHFLHQVSGLSIAQLIKGFDAP